MAPELVRNGGFENNLIDWKMNGIEGHSNFVNTLTGKTPYEGKGFGSLFAQGTTAYYYQAIKTPVFGEVYDIIYHGSGHRPQFAGKGVTWHPTNPTDIIVALYAGKKDKNSLNISATGPEGNLKTCELLLNLSPPDEGQLPCDNWLEVAYHGVIPKPKNPLFDTIYFTVLINNGLVGPIILDSISIRRYINF